MADYQIDVTEDAKVDLDYYSAYMKTVDLAHQKWDLELVIGMARQEPVLILTPDGKEFCLAEADDFEREVQALRGSREFQSFLDKRSACKVRIPLEDIENELQQDS